MSPIFVANFCRQFFVASICRQISLINMATQPVGNPRQILTQIVQQIGDLSQALIMSEQSVEVNGYLASNNTIEAEVRSVFTGHRANPTGPVLSSNEAVEAPTSNATTATQRELAVLPSQSSSRNTTTPLYNVRRQFNNQRTAIRNRRSSRSNATPIACRAKAGSQRHSGPIHP